MNEKPAVLRHPFDTPLSSGLRFLTELIAWTAGPWLAAGVSKWLILPTLLVLVGLPAVFSTSGDKKNVVVPTPGPVRVAIELGLYAVAGTIPWFLWPVPVAWAALLIVLASLGFGMPRILWLLRGASDLSG